MWKLIVLFVLGALLLFLSHPITVVLGTGCVIYALCEFFDKHFDIDDRDIGDDFQ